MVNQSGPAISDEFEYRGIETVFMENDALRIMVLPGKGGDILEFRDKRTDVDPLWHANHKWQPPENGTTPPVDPTTWHDHYPGGWQVNLPVAGYTEGFGDAPYGLHGESSLIPFESRVEQTPDAVRLHLSTDLVRYPFHVERTLTLAAGEPTLHVEESITNESPRKLPYVWQYHLALGRPLIGPSARLDVPAATGVVDDYGPDHKNARLAGDETFDWPHAPGKRGDTVDLREFPPTDSTIHDVAYATDLDEGWYAVTNPDLNVGFAFSFPVDPFESIWYWQPFGGHHTSPYFNRNYNVGLEPTTAYPASNIPDAQEENGTMKHLEAGETVTGSFAAIVYHGLKSVDGVSSDGTVTGE